jgi:hypothetical protein
MEGLVYKWNKKNSPVRRALLKPIRFPLILCSLFSSGFSHR